MADNKLDSLMNALAETMENVFKEEVEEPVAFVLVAMNKTTKQCGYISNNSTDLKLLIDLMRETVRRYEETGPQPLRKH